eukprot:UN24762
MVSIEDFLEESSAFYDTDQENEPMNVEIRRAKTPKVEKNLAQQKPSLKGMQSDDDLDDLLLDDDEDHFARVDRLLKERKSNERSSVANTVTESKKITIEASAPEITPSAKIQDEDVQMQNVEAVEENSETNQNEVENVQKTDAFVTTDNIEKEETNQEIN